MAAYGGFSKSKFELPPQPQLRALLDDSLRAGLRRAMEKKKSKDEVAITAMVRESEREGDGSEKIDVIVHLGFYVPDALRKGARLALVGRGRDLAEAKRTDWVR